MSNTKPTRVSLKQINPDRDWNFNNFKITNVQSPSQPSDVANKGYVDNAIRGLNAKQSVVCATTDGIELTEPQYVIDGVTLVPNMRVLVKDQMYDGGSDNGIYYVDSDHLLHRTPDADDQSKLVSAFVFVEMGNVNADTGWVCILDRNVNGSNFCYWIRFSTSIVHAGQGLRLDGNTLHIEYNPEVLGVDYSNRLFVQESSIGEQHLKGLSVASMHIQTGAVVDRTLASNCVKTQHIADEQITASKLNAGMIGDGLERVSGKLRVKVGGLLSYGSGAVTLDATTVRNNVMSRMQTMEVDLTSNQIFVAGVGIIAVYINGLRMREGKDYTVSDFDSSGKTVTILTEAYEYGASCLIECWV